MQRKADKQVDDFGRKDAKIENKLKKIKEGKLSKLFLWWVHPTCIRKKLVLFLVQFFRGSGDCENMSLVVFPS